MFFDEKTERQILHNSTSKVPYDNKPLVKQRLVKSPVLEKPPPRAVGGSRKSKKEEDNGVSTLKPPKILYSSSMSGGSKRKPTAYQELLKKVRQEKGLSLKDAMKYVKDNNLY